MAKVNYEKKYYEKLLNSINRDDKDGFYKEFTNAIKSGKLEYSQKRIKGQLSFDDAWINTIIDYLGYLEKIVRNPRLYMQAEENVTPIQSAKKINARSVQHLSSHVQNVQEIRDDGTIVPSKVLSTTYEDTLNIYENRFIMTLINKLAAFVEVRYAQIEKNVNSYQIDNLVVNDSFEWRNYHVDTSFNLKVREDIEDEISKKNQELVEKILTIRSYLRGFMNSLFYNQMKQAKARPITPPVLRTNIITHSVDYNSCLKLWQFIDSYRELGVEVGVFDKDLELDADFTSKVADMIMLNYSLVVDNLNERSENYDLLPYKFHKEKPPVKNNLLVVSDMLNEIDRKSVDEPSISEYYYQRMKRNYKYEFTSTVNSGISYNKSFVNVYRKMLKIENGVQEEIIEGIENHLDDRYPGRSEKSKKKTYLSKKRSIYKSVLWLKKQDMERIEKKLAKVEEELAKYDRKRKKRKDIQDS